MQKNLSPKKTLVNATLQLISGNRFQNVNTQNIKDQCTTHFYMEHDIIAANFFSL